MGRRNSEVGKTLAMAGNGERVGMVVSPYPAPELVRQYTEIQPDAADRILKIVEKEQEADHALTKREETHEFVLKAMGIVAATILCLAALGGGVFLIVRGAVASGWASIVGALVVVITTIAAGGKK